MNTSSGRLAALIVAAAAVLSLTPAPANASLLGGSARHYSPDTGYDADLIVRCDGGETRRIPEGDHSDDICGDEDVDAIYVRDNEEWWARNGSTRQADWEKAYDAQGWHDWPGAANGTFVLHRD